MDTKYYIKTSDNIYYCEECLHCSDKIDGMQSHVKSLKHRHCLNPSVQIKGQYLHCLKYINNYSLKIANLIINEAVNNTNNSAIAHPIKKIEDICLNKLYYINSKPFNYQTKFGKIVLILVEDIENHNLFYIPVGSTISSFFKHGIKFYSYDYEDYDICTSDSEVIYKRPAFDGHQRRLLTENEELNKSRQKI